MRMRLVVASLAEDLDLVLNTRISSGICFRWIHILSIESSVQVIA